MIAEVESVRIKRKLVRLIGIGYFLLGCIVILISSENITGLVISENFSGTYGQILGIVFIVAGILIFLSARKRYNEFKGRDSLRRHNEEARFYAQQDYTEEYGRHPNNPKLRNYIRRLHERGKLSDVIEEQRQKKKALVEQGFFT